MYSNPWKDCLSTKGEETSTAFIQSYHQFFKKNFQYPFRGNAAGEILE